MIVVLRLVDLVVAGRPRDRLIHDQRRRRQAAVDRRRIHDRLEGGAQLAICLDGAVELAAPEAPAADHRANLPCPVLDGDERAFDERGLLERDDGLPGGFVERRHADLDQIADSK